MLVRLLILLVAVVVVVAVARRLCARAEGATASRVIDAKTVRCARCQVYFPTQEAIVQDGQSFCSRAHADAGSRQP